MLNFTIFFNRLTGIILSSAFIYIPIYWDTTASTNSMGEVNFISAAVSTVPVDSNNTVIGPGENQTNGVFSC